MGTIVGGMGMKVGGPCAGGATMTGGPGPGIGRGLAVRLEELLEDLGDGGIT